MVVILAKDAITFIRTFAIPVWSSVPHIYLSGLALSHSNSQIYQHYAANFPNLLHCTSNTHAMPIQAIIQTEADVRSIDISSDQKKIVSCLMNVQNTLCVWDAGTLQQIGQCLGGHTDYVTSVAFS